MTSFMHFCLKCLVFQTIAVEVMNGATLEVGSAGLTLGNAANLTVDGTLKITSMSAVIDLQNAGYTLDGSLDLSDVFDSAAAGNYQLINATTSDDASVNILGFNASNLDAAFANGILTLTAVPEPSAYALLISGLVAGFPIWRRSIRAGRK